MNTEPGVNLTSVKNATLRDRIGQVLSSPEHIIVMLLTAAVVCLWWNIGAGLNNDTKVQLHYAMLLLKEGGLYDRWIEVNPPLIFFLYLPPAWLITENILNPKLALNLYTTMLCLGSIFAVWRALKPLEIREQLGWTSLCSFALLVVPNFCFVFGDREHLLFIFGLPWMMQMLLGMEPRAWSVVMAAPGIFLKPYNLLICGALLLFGGPPKTFMGRVFSRSSMIFLALGLVYLAVVFIWFPGYPFYVAPMLLVVYREIVKPIGLQAWRIQPFVAVAGILYMMGRLRNTMPRFALEAMIVASIGVYFLNGGWLYTLYLLCVPCLIAAFTPMMSGPGEGANAQRKFEAARAFSGSLLLVVTLFCGLSLNVDYDFTRSGLYGRGYNHIPAEFGQRLLPAAGENYVLLSPTLWASNVTDLGQSPHQLYAYDSLWMLPWLYAHPDSPHRQQIQDAVALPLVRALETHPRVIVDESRLLRTLPNNLDILKFLRQDPRIATAFKGYQRIDEINVCSKEWYAACRFGIWAWQPGEQRTNVE